MIATGSKPYPDTYTLKVKENDLESFLNEELLAISKKFDIQYKKQSLINRIRKLYKNLFFEQTFTNKILSIKDENSVLKETLTFKTEKGIDVELIVKSHKLSINNFSLNQNDYTNIIVLNRTVEEAKPLLGLKNALMLREYFWDLIQMSTDCQYGCYFEHDEFVFKYIDPVSKTTIELFVMQ